MLRVVVMVSGGGTNLQAILDAIDGGKITGASVEAVISNNRGAYALERAKKHGIPAVCVSPKDYEDRAAFNRALLEKVKEYQPDLVVLAGFLVTIPPEMIREYPGKIINIHPSLIPSFCGVGYYGLKVHEAALKRGVKVTGATVHYVDEGVDSGPADLVFIQSLPAGQAVCQIDHIIPPVTKTDHIKEVPGQRNHLYFFGQSSLFQRKRFAFLRQ